MVLHSVEPGNRREVQREGEVTEFPEALTARGFKLVERAPDRLFAVSSAWGCTGTKTTIRDVVAEAWGLVGFIEYVNREKVNEASLRPAEL